MFVKGDRVEMVKMENDPCPIPTGTQGTVVNAVEFDLGDGSYVQLDVKWDNGRTLMPCIPPDEVKFVDPNCPCRICEIRRG